MPHKAKPLSPSWSCCIEVISYIQTCAFQSFFLQVWGQCFTRPLGPHTNVRTFQCSFVQIWGWFHKAPLYRGFVKLVVFASSFMGVGQTELFCRSDSKQGGFAESQGKGFCEVRSYVKHPSKGLHKALDKGLCEAPKKGSFGKPLNKGLNNAPISWATNMPPKVFTLVLYY